MLGTLKLGVRHLEFWRSGLRKLFFFNASVVLMRLALHQVQQSILANKRIRRLL